MNWIRNNFALLAVLGISIPLLLLNILLLRQNSDLRSQLESFHPARLKAGDKVSGFIAKNLNGETISFNYLENNNKRILMYFAPTCQYCKQQFPKWREVINHSKENHLDAFGIVHEGENSQEIKKYLDDFNLGMSSESPLQVLFVSDETLKSYKLNRTPTTILVSEDGIVEQSWVGKTESFF